MAGNHGRPLRFSWIVKQTIERFIQQEMVPIDVDDGHTLNITPIAGSYRRADRPAERPQHPADVIPPHIMDRPVAPIHHGRDLIIGHACEHLQDANPTAVIPWQL
ncbi:hypothetical protein D3C80_1455290 [compost metagenome]